MPRSRRSPAARRVVRAARRSARYPMIPAHNSGARLLVAEPVREAVGVALVDDRVLGVATVGVPPGERRIHAQVLVAAPAEPARPARPPQPGHADPLADLEPRRAVAECVDRADDLVARDDLACVRRRGHPRPGAGRSGTRHRPRRVAAPRPGRASESGAPRMPAARRRSARGVERPTPSSPWKTARSGRRSKGDRHERGPGATDPGAARSGERLFRRRGPVPPGLRA